MADLNFFTSQVDNAFTHRGALTTIASAFGAGVATSLTPCVYPMIAVTVSVFGAHEAKSRGRGALLSSAFVIGMASLFVPLGLVAALTGGVFGAALASPVVLVALAVVFSLLAASMFGLFDLDLPSGLKTRIATMGGVGLRGAFVLGMMSALIAAPCTGPVLGALLTWIGGTRDVLIGGLSLFAYALGLGLLFFIVGTFAVTLPKSGRWLNWVKSVFGIVMLAAAYYYVRALLPDVQAFAGVSRAQWCMAAVALLSGGLVLGAVQLQFAYASTRERLRKAGGVTLCVAGLACVVRASESLAEGAQQLAWTEDVAQAREEARRDHKPILIDFSASWCGACGELERHTFSHPSVIREAQRFVTVRVDLSPGKDSAAKRAWLADYAQRGLPLVVMHDARGDERSRVTGFMGPDEFAALLRAVD